MVIINEDSRNTLVAKSKSGEREKDGKTRFQKRVKSRVINNNAQYNKIDMNQLFKQGILTVSIPVRGETDSYLVTLSFRGFLDSLHKELKKEDAKLDIRNIVRAIVSAFNTEDVYIRCSCPDWKYRFGYWATRNNIIVGEKEDIPSDETNPDDRLGPACKHVLLVLSNSAWIIKVASVIYNYVNYMKNKFTSLYADVIYPAIYDKPYTEPVQTSMFDQDDLSSKESDIDLANQEARRKGQFKQGNDYRFRPSEIVKGQETMIDSESEVEA